MEDDSYLGGKMQYQYRVYFPARYEDDESLWPHWFGWAGGYEDALEKAMKEMPNASSSLPTRLPKNGDYVAVVNITKQGNGMSIFTYVTPEPVQPPPTFERRLREEV